VSGQGQLKVSSRSVQSQDQIKVKSRSSEVNVRSRSCYSQVISGQIKSGNVRSGHEKFSSDLFMSGHMRSCQFKLGMVK